MYQYPPDMEFGDMVVCTSEWIQCGGAVPVGLAARTPRVIAFFAVANYIYNITTPFSS